MNDPEALVLACSEGIGGAIERNEDIMNIRMPEQMVAFVCQVKITEPVHSRIDSTDTQITPQIMTDYFLLLSLPPLCNPAVAKEVQSPVIMNDIEALEVQIFQCFVHNRLSTPIVELKISRFKDIPGLAYQEGRGPRLRSSRHGF